MADSAQVQRLLDIEEIKQLKARYFRGMDTKQWDAWGQVFTSDAVMEIPEANMIVTGRDEIVKAVSTVLVGTTTVHHGHMPEIEITSPTTATGIWAMEDYVDWGADGGAFRGYGHYHETYEKVDGQWRITSSTLTRLREDIFNMFVSVYLSDRIKRAIRRVVKP